MPLLRPKQTADPYASFFILFFSTDHALPSWRNLHPAVQEKLQVPLPYIELVALETAALKLNPLHNHHFSSSPLTKGIL